MRSPHRPARPTSVLVAALTTCALGLSACSGGGSDGEGGAGDGDGAAYDTTTLMPAVSAAVADEESAHVTLGTKESAGDIEADVSWGEDPALVAVTGDQTGAGLEVRRVGGRVYVGGAAAKDRWRYLEEDDPRLQGAEGFDAGVVPILLAIDVPAEVAALEAGVTDVGEATPDEVAGEDATRYDITLDTKSWLAELPQESIYRVMDVPAELEAELWIDEDARPVQLAYQVGDDAARSALVGWSAWGEQVQVEVPEGAKPVR
ncbi:hypothetical protein [Nocardioides sp. Soil805]|uniref:hypothetical protein n=1 Tax=Nocardioides sp. Soil805 TaxID=1736416 RepID=UPI000702593D|nr:hypothetical protein [Nocardioides sp. Soil805]KRF34207.1 hypothetical protein ASG94_15915 [Nocardioides sp. Soil805]